MIESLYLKDFRKFKYFKLDCNHKVIIFTGANAVGKTSILEAIYLMATSKSHRTTEYLSLIRDNQEFAVVELIAEKKYKMVISKKGKQFFVNQINIQRVSDFIGQISVILFSPTDIELIQGSKGIRRRFIDLELSLLDHSYLKEIMVYKRYLKERNEILKDYEENKKLILDVITKQIIEKIKIIYKKRINFISKMNQTLNLVCVKLECEEISLQYIPSYDIANLERSFERKLSYDIFSKTTNIGLHRDDIDIFMNHTDAKTYASEGQKRSIALAMKLALKQIYESAHKEVVLLLDDVFASLDQSRINHIMDYIEGESQTMITTTSLFNIPDKLIKDAKIVKL